MNFYRKVAVFLGIFSLTTYAWENKSCPSICTCQLQHLTETAIYRFMQNDKKPLTPEEPGENNEVIYDETLDGIEFNESHRTTVVRSATCILQTETDPLELIELLPSNYESLSFIQGYKSGNKTIKFSWLTKFEKLLSLELVGPMVFRKDVSNHLMCHIDYALENLNFLNLERVLVKNSKEQIQSFLEVLKDSEDITFEYVQKGDGDIHPLTIMQKSSANEEVVPYEVYKEQRKTNGEIPLFTGFKGLQLLRIANCELNTIHWEMFDSLENLEYLILERNNLSFIPAFAFYGTPNLKSLSLAHNKLLAIELTDLAGLLQLEFLDLTYNNFTHLSELSFPPFPRLKLANFANNPISVIYPNTFEVMNTTDSLIIGSEEMALTLLPNSFAGLRLLKTVTVNNVDAPLLKRDFFVGMPQLKELILTGNISKIEFDAFQEVNKLERLILSQCHIYNISMDGFLGLKKLRYLDLSKNLLEHIPTGVFDDLDSIKELYLNGNKLKTLPREIFLKIHPKLLRLNENPWHCSCEMSEWKPVIASRIKQKTTKSCDFSIDKGLACAGMENRFEYKFMYDARVSPKCTEPKQFKNWSVFHAMRKILKCPDYKPKFLTHKTLHSNSTISEVAAPKTANKKLKSRARKMKYLRYKLKKNSLLTNKINLNETAMDSSLDNELNSIQSHSEEMNQLRPQKKRT